MTDVAPKASRPATQAPDQQIAVVYAKALLGATEKAGSSAQVLDELAQWATVLQDQPTLERVLASPLVGEEQKQGLIDRIFAPRSSPLLIDFLRVLAKRGRLGSLRTLAAEFRRQHDELRGIVGVEVITATPLDAATGKQLSESLRALVHGEPRLENTVNPDLIGGVVLRVGDTVYDGSIARQLEQLRSQIIHRSVHEIQSRRDRFRHPGGN